MLGLQLKFKTVEQGHNYKSPEHSSQHVDPGPTLGSTSATPDLDKCHLEKSAGLSLLSFLMTRDALELLLECIITFQLSRVSLEKDKERLHAMPIGLKAPFAPM